MNTENQQIPKESQLVPDNIIKKEIDSTEVKKNNVQEKMEGGEPSDDETEVNPEDAKISRSE